MAGHNDGPTSNKTVLPDGETGAQTAKTETRADEAVTRTEEPKPRTLVGRRDYLRAIGATGAAAMIGSAMGAASADDDHEVITIPRDTFRTYNIGRGRADGRGFENVIFDVTARGAGIAINTYDGFYLRNVGVRGSNSKGRDRLAQHEQFAGGAGFMRCRGSGVIENCYFGDGVVAGVDAWFCNIGTDFDGRLEVRNTNIGGWTHTAFYCTAYAENGTGGHLELDNCYLHNNNIAHYRVVGNAEIKNSVIVNHNQVRPQNSHGGGTRVINSRGVWARRPRDSSTSIVLVENCDIAVTGSNTCPPDWNEIPTEPESVEDHSSCGASALSATDNPIRVVDSRIRGSTSGDVRTSNVGGNPDTSPPDGVPMSAEEAVGAETDSGNGTGETEEPFDYTLTVSGESEPDTASYTFVVDGEVDPATRYGASINEDFLEIEELEDGRVRVTNAIANARNSYEITGCVVEFEHLDGPEKQWLRDDEPIDEDEIVDCKPEDEEEGSDDGEDEDEVGEGEPGDGDEDESGDDEGADDGSDDDSPSDLPYTIVFDGTVDDGVGSYRMTVTGDIEPDSERSTGNGLPWDRLEPKITDGDLIGVVGNAKDAYRFSGSITRLKVYGKVSVEFSDNS